MKKLYINLLLVLSLLAAHAQQIGMVSHYFYKPMVYNPAFTGSDDGINLMLINHTQWQGFKGAPRLNIFTLDKPLANKKVGIGLELISDKRGINSRIGGNLFYSYRINFHESAHLSMGLSLGMIDQSLDYSKVILENATDATLLTGSEHQTTYDANAGLAFVWTGLEAGIAFPQLIGNKIPYDNANVQAHYTQARHYIGSLKYKFFISQDKGISIAPQTLIRFIPNTPMQYDGHLTIDWNKKFWLGAAYKSNYAITLNAGFSIRRQLSIGYAYDIITGDIGKYSGISHEIMVAIQFGKNKKEKPKPVAEEPVKTESQPEKVDSSAYLKHRADSLQKIIEEQAKLKMKQERIKAEQDKARMEQERIKAEQEKARMEQERIKAEQDKTRMEQERIKAEQDKARAEQERIKAEQEKIKAQQNKAATQVPKNTEKSAGNTNRVIDNGIWIATNSAQDFIDATNRVPQKGFYVVVGSFHNREFALAEVQRLIKQGYKTTNWIYHVRSNFNYVFTIKSDSKKEAINQANNAKAAGIEGVWIQHIVE